MNTGPHTHTHRLPHTPPQISPQRGAHTLTQHTRDTHTDSCRLQIHKCTHNHEHNHTHTHTHIPDTAHPCSSPTASPSTPPSWVSCSPGPAERQLGHGGGGGQDGVVPPTPYRCKYQPVSVSVCGCVCTSVGAMTVCARECCTQMCPTVRQATGGTEPALCRTGWVCLRAQVGVLCLRLAVGVGGARGGRLPGSM